MAPPTASQPSAAWSVQERDAALRTLVAKGAASGDFLLEEDNDLTAQYWATLTRRTTMDKEVDDVLCEIARSQLITAAPAPARAPPAEQPKSPEESLATATPAARLAAEQREHKIRRAKVSPPAQGPAPSPLPARQPRKSFRLPPFDPVKLMEDAGLECCPASRGKMDLGVCKCEHSRNKDRWEDIVGKAAIVMMGIEMGKRLRAKREADKVAAAMR